MVYFTEEKGSIPSFEDVSKLEKYQTIFLNVPLARVQGEDTRFRDLKLPFPLGKHLGLPSIREDYDDPQVQGVLSAETHLWLKTDDYSNVYECSQCGLRAWTIWEKNGMHLVCKQKNVGCPADISPTLKAIRREVDAQDKQWGGLTHDREHTHSDWLNYIEKQMWHIYRQEGAPHERYLKIAALCVSAIRASQPSQGLQT